MIKIATIPAVKRGKIILIPETIIEQHTVDRSYYVSQDDGGINIDHIICGQIFEAIKKNEAGES